MILLPALLKEALGVDTLGFQIVPGLSSGSSKDVALVDNEAARVGYLTDGDGAGREIAKKLRDAGIPQDRILALPMLNGEDTVLEDLVSTNAYTQAVNEELKRSGVGAVCEESALSAPNRPRRLEKWCVQNKAGIPSKRAIAYHLLESRIDSPIVDPALREVLGELCAEIKSMLGLEG